MRYYWCVNCGYCGDFGFERLKNQKCESCNYDDLVPYDADEWEESGKREKHEWMKKDPKYDGRYKYKETKLVGKKK